MIDDEGYKLIACRNRKKNSTYSFTSYELTKTSCHLEKLSAFFCLFNNIRIWAYLFYRYCYCCYFL